MANKIELDARWLTVPAVLLVAVGCVIGMLLAPQPDAAPATITSAASSDERIVHELQQLRLASERSAQQPTVIERTPASPSPRTDDIAQLCEAIYALIESRATQASGHGEFVRSIPATNVGAVEATLSRLRAAEESGQRRASEVLMESRAALLRRYGRPTEVEMSQVGSPIWRYDLGDETLHIDFSVGGYVIGVRRSH